MITESMILCGSIAAHAVSAGAHCVSILKQQQLQKMIHQQRIELYAVEGVMIGAIAFTVIDNQVTKNKIEAIDTAMAIRDTEIKNSISKLEEDIAKLKDRMNGLDLSNINSKLDKLNEAIISK